MRAAWAATIGVVLSLGVALHEWFYYRQHAAHARGASGVLIVLALAAACGCFASAEIAWRQALREQQQDREWIGRFQRDAEAGDPEE